jgi:ABC-type sugar transport system substrate-binding protein
MMGKLGIEQASRLLKGEQIPAHIPVKIEMITLENVDAKTGAAALVE